jgi:glycosyltransferase involved in cell wall biosynthesis
VAEQQPGPIVCLSRSFPPSTAPTAIRAGKLLERLAADRDVVLITENGEPRTEGRLRVEVVTERKPARALTLLRRLRMDKLLELALWPDESVFWVLPALLAARRVARETRPEAIVVFMMPYSSGLAGVLLRRLTGRALVLNLDDSPTCTDMHPDFPSRMHHRLAQWLEDLYVRESDAAVYVSRRNLELIASRQREQDRHKLHLVRYGADPRPLVSHPQADRFEILYVGAMSGWWSLIDDGPGSLAARLYRRWERLGRHRRLELDQRTSSPAPIGQAILQVLERHPQWRGRLRLALRGNPYPPELASRALEQSGVTDVVDVSGPVPHAGVAELLTAADLLFITLPKRLDGSPGGRISAKTYEYLATDRPILAAVPRGENWEYLEGRPGVWLVEPDDSDGMSRAIAELAEAKFAGEETRFDRGALRAELSYDTRAQEMAAVIAAAVEHAAARRR